MILVTCLVHLFPPKHHVRAMRIIDEVLKQEPDNISCLLGRAYILRDSKKWPEAGDLFARVVDLLPGDTDEGLRAKEEQAWCQVQSGDTEAGSIALLDVLAELNGLEDRDLDQARCLWRLGKCYWEMGGEWHHMVCMCIADDIFYAHRRPPRGSIPSLRSVP